MGVVRIIEIIKRASHASAAVQHTAATWSATWRCVVVVLVIVVEVVVVLIISLMIVMTLYFVFT